MLDELISLILSLPNLKLKLSPESFRNFFSVTNEIGYKITEASFEEYMKHHPDISFGFLIEKYHILSYLRIWPSILAELNFFMKLHGIAWYEKYHEALVADDLLPLIIAYMPKDKKILTELVAQLDTLVRIDSASEPCCYLTSFAIAALAKQDELKPIDIQLLDLQGVPVSDEKPPLTYVLLKPEKHIELITKIKEKPIYLCILCTVIKLSDYTNHAQIYHANQIYLALAKLNIHDYDLETEGIGEEHREHLISIKITEMLSCVTQEPFCSQPLLSEHIKKYIAYHDLYSTLEDRRSRSFQCLYTFMMKINEIYQPILSDDLRSCTIDIPNLIAMFIALPTTKTWAPILFPSSPKMKKVLLRDFINLLTIKMEELDEVRVKARTTSYPPPPQPPRETEASVLTRSM
jgi:hypothetical protein